jgi:hypothetical protein
MSNKFCGPDIIKFFSVEPIPPNPCSFEPISVQNLEGCQFLNITGYTGPTINLPNLSLTDINGAYDTTQMVSGLTISNGEITSFTLDGCGLSIDVNAPSPFPINLNNSDGCKINSIVTDPSGTFVLDDTQFTDTSGVFGTSPISKNININAYISSISASTDGCDTIIQIEDCFPLDIVNTFGCTIDTVDECCKGKIWNARLGSGAFIQNIDLVNCGGKVYTDPTRYDGLGIYQFCHAGLTQPNVQVQSGSILWTDTGERCNMPVILDNPSITDDDGLFGNYASGSDIVIENGTIDTITTSACTTTITLSAASSPSGIAYKESRPYIATTSFATGDSTYFFNLGAYDRTNPTFPEYYAEIDFTATQADVRVTPATGTLLIDSVGPTMLQNNNAFGNKFRFTDSLGNPSDASVGSNIFAHTDWRSHSFSGAVDKYVIDHLTGWGYDIQYLQVGTFFNMDTSTSDGQDWTDWMNSIASLGTHRTFTDWLPLDISDEPSMLQGMVATNWASSFFIFEPTNVGISRGSIITGDSSLSNIFYGLIDNNNTAAVLGVIGTIGSNSFAFRIMNCFVKRKHY